MIQDLQTLIDPVISYLPNLLAAIAILVVGWLVAVLLASIVRAALKRTTIDNRIAEFVAGKEKGRAIDVENAVGKIVFYMAMLFVLVAFFQALGLTLITEPLNAFLNRFLAFAPQLLGATLLIVVAWLLATGLRVVTTRLLERVKLDERVSQTAQVEDAARVPLSKTLGDVVYWLILLLFLPAVLGTLALDGLLQPVQSLVNEVLSYAPNVLTAGLIILVGWFVARTVQHILTNLLSAAGLDGVGERVGFDRAVGGKKLSSLIGLVAYVLILIPVVVASLNALNIQAITAPASNMLDTLLAALPGLFAAALVLAIAYVVGRVLSSAASALLGGAGFDGLVARVGVTSERPERSPSTIVGWLLFAAIMLFAAIEASDLMGFTTLAVMLADLLELGGRLIAALVVFALGLYLANLAVTAITSSEIRYARPLAIIARVAILTLAGAMALGEIGVAEEIITLAFGLTLGAIAVAAAVAFGIGGRDLAAKQLEQWQSALQKEGGGR